MPDPRPSMPTLDDPRRTLDTLDETLDPSTTRAQLLTRAHPNSISGHLIDFSRERAADVVKMAMQQPACTPTTAKSTSLQQQQLEPLELDAHVRGEHPSRAGMPRRAGPREPSGRRARPCQSYATCRSARRDAGPSSNRPARRLSACARRVWQQRERRWLFWRRVARAVFLQTAPCGRRALVSRSRSTC